MRNKNPDTPARGERHVSAEIELEKISRKKSRDDNSRIKIGSQWYSIQHDPDKKYPSGAWGEVKILTPIKSLTDPTPIEDLPKLVMKRLTSAKLAEEKVLFGAKGEITDAVVCASKILDDKYKTAHYETVIKKATAISPGETHAHEVEIFCYHEGGELFDALNENKERPTNAELTTGFIDIAKQMVLLHTAGLVHRDIKPENIIITHDNKLKLADAGNAKAATSHTRTSKITPEYSTQKNKAAAEAGSDIENHFGVDYYALKRSIEVAADTKKGFSITNDKTLNELYQLLEDAMPTHDNTDDAVREGRAKQAHQRLVTQLMTEPEDMVHVIMCSRYDAINNIDQLNALKKEWSALSESDAANVLPALRSLMHISQMSQEGAALPDIKRGMLCCKTTQKPSEPFTLLLEEAAKLARSVPTDIEAFKESVAALDDQLQEALENHPDLKRTYEENTRVSLEALSNEKKHNP